MTALARTPLHHWHARAGARFVVIDGWEVAAGYGGVGDQTTAGLAFADVSAFAKVSLLGRGVAALCAERFRDTPAMRPGGVAVLGEKGRDLACRLSDDHLLILGSTVRAAWQLPMSEDVTHSSAGFWLFGAAIPELMRHLTARDVSPTAFPPGSCAQAPLGGVPALLVHPPRPPMSLRICVAWDLGEYVWERIWEAGRAWNIAPLGHEALGSLLSRSGERGASAP
jgi:glycine cleavage system aminomethyltransferase T